MEELDQYAQGHEVLGSIPNTSIKKKERKKGFLFASNIKTIQFHDIQGHVLPSSSIG